MLKRIWMTSVLVMLSIMLSITAQGYVLEGPHILELMVQTLSGAKTVRVEQRVVLEKEAHTEQPLAFSEILSYAFPDRFRSDTAYEDTNRIFVRSAGETLTVMNNHRVETPENRFDRYVNLLLYRSRPAVHRMLLSYDVDVETASLGRFEDRVVYVLGAQYPDESASQVWVDKESLLPLRWINASVDDPDDRFEFIYRNWQKKDNLWYPALIEVWYQKARIRQIIAIDLQVDVALPGALFDIARLMQTFPLEEATVPPGETESDVDEVERTIEQFQRKFDN